MRTDNSPHGKQTRRSEPSFWSCEPTNDTPSLIEDALRGDELAARPPSVREENARLRKLAVQLSNMLGDLPATTAEPRPSAQTKASGKLDDVIINLTRGDS